MREYRLGTAAEQDLAEIYTYSYSESGERQADAYFQSLENCLTRLARRPALGVDACTLREGYQRAVHQRHTVYYKAAKEGILVVRVLGPGMAPDRNLP